MTMVFHLMSTFKAADNPIMVDVAAGQVSKATTVRYDASRDGLNLFEYLPNDPNPHLIDIANRQVGSNPDWWFRGTISTPPLLPGQVYKICATVNRTQPNADS